MPSYAHLLVDLLCPYCVSLVTDEVWFQRGLCNRYSPDPINYQLGESIRWKACEDKSIPKWTYFGYTALANIGDPLVKDLIVRDTSPLFQGELECTNCRRQLKGAAVEIRDGIIVRAWIYNSELDNATDIYVIEDRESITPMPDWNDHPMQVIEDC